MTTQEDVPLSPRVRAFLEPPRFASIATIDPDGAPRQSVVWYLLDGDALVLNSLVGRRWPANLVRDGRVAMSVIDAANPYSWIGLKGSTEVRDDADEAFADISAMARRYYRDDPDQATRLIEERFRPQRRISFRVLIAEVHDHLEED